MIEAVAIPEDLSWVRLREADEAECQVGGMTGAEAVAQSRDLSDECWMIQGDGEPMAFWGYYAVSVMGNVAMGWLLTLPAVDAVPRVLARSSRRVVDYILQKYPTLIVQTHYQHYTAMRWLEWLGFEELRADGPYTLMVKRRA